MPIDTDLRDLLERTPLASSREIQTALEVSQATVSRLVRRAGSAVVRVGRGPATRYALGGPALGADRELRLFAVNDAGDVAEIASLRGLSGGRHLVEPLEPSPWLLGTGGNGVYPSIPYFLEELRPSGFVGRQVGRKLAAEWGIAENPRHWGRADLGRYLRERGDDLPGNLVVGDASAERLAPGSEPTAMVARDEYPELAGRALRGEVPGSSAAGEQPKFVVFTEDAGHVIVKFASPSGRSPETRRWADLLRAEAHAGQVLQERGIPAADSVLLEIGDRVFLESRRFDRLGRHGRRGAISLEMVDAEFVGEGQRWTRVAAELRERGLLSAEHARTVAWLEAFGRWIGNTDMHLGNVALRPTSDGFELLPAYDMLPMMLAPQRGEMLEPDLHPPIRTADNRDHWRAIADAAADFWSRFAADPGVSGNVRRHARQFETRCRAA